MGDPIKEKNNTPILHNPTIYPDEAWLKQGLTSCYDDMERNGGRYAARALHVTNPGDKIQLDPDIMENIAWMMDHMDDLGIPHAAEEDIIPDTSPERANDYPDMPLSVYIFGDQIHAVRPNERRYQAVKFFMKKNNFISYAQQNGHPILETQILKEGDEPKYDAVYPVIIKPDDSTRGEGFEKAHDKDELKRKLTEYCGGLQVQTFVDGDWLSVQFKVVGGKAEHVASMGQIMRGYTHIGNRHPTRHDLAPFADGLAQEMADAGLEDEIGIDLVALPRKDGESGFYSVEVNPRSTGATAPIHLARKLDIENWQSRSLPTKLSGPGELDLGKLRFDRERQMGVVVLNNSKLDLGGLAKPVVEVMIAGTPEQQELLLPKVSRILREPARKKSISVPTGQRAVASY